MAGRSKDAARHQQNGMLRLPAGASSGSSTWRSSGLRQHLGASGWSGRSTDEADDG